MTELKTANIQKLTAKPCASKIFNDRLLGFFKVGKRRKTIPLEWPRKLWLQFPGKI